MAEREEHEKFFAEEDNVTDSSSRDPVKPRQLMSNDTLRGSDGPTDLKDCNPIEEPQTPSDNIHQYHPRVVNHPIIQIEPKEEIQQSILNHQVQPMRNPTNASSFTL